MSSEIVLYTYTFNVYGVMVSLNDCLSKEMNVLCTYAAVLQSILYVRENDMNAVMPM